MLKAPFQLCLPEHFAESIEMSQTTLANCPLCGRTVRAGQTACSCGAVLRDRTSPPPEDPQYLRFDYGKLLPWLPAAGLLMLFLLVLPVSPIHFPGTRLLKVIAVLFILSALFCF